MKRFLLSILILLSSASFIMADEDSLTAVSVPASTDTIRSTTPDGINQISTYSAIKADIASGSSSSSGGGNGGAAIETFIVDGRKLNIQNDTSVSAMTQDSTYIYAAAWDSSGHLVLGRKAKANPAGIWENYTYDGTGGRATITLTGDDYHDGISLGIDTAGTLHVVYDQHADALKYRTSTSPQDPSGLSATKSMLGTNETAVSYMNFFNDSNGVLFCTFRDGASALGDEYMYKYTVGTTTWSAATGTSTAGIFYSGDITGTANDSSMYVSAPYLDTTNNKALFVYVIAYNTGGVTDNRKNFSFFSYDMTNGTFNKSSGVAHTVPFNATTADVVAATAFDKGLRDIQNTPNVTKDAAGVIYAVFDGADANNHNQVNLAKYSSGAWTTRALTQSGACLYSPLTAGALSCGDPTPFIMVDSDDKLHVIYRDINQSQGVSIITSEDGFATWAQRGLYSGSVGSWKPNVNNKALMESKKLYMVSQFHASLTETYTRTPVYIISWNPSTDGYSQQIMAGLFKNIDDISIASENGNVVVNTNSTATGGDFKVMVDDVALLTVDGSAGTILGPGASQICQANGTGCPASGAGGWTDGGTTIYNSTSTDNVGIGTINATSFVQLFKSDTTAFSTGTAATGRLIISNSSTSDNNMSQLAFGTNAATTGSGVSDGLISLIHRAHVSGAPVADLAIQVRNTNYTDASTIYLKANGNVGIGTLAPTSKLSVWGGAITTLTAGANTACTTTCGAHACYGAFDTSVTPTPVDCTDATADTCYCSK